MTDLDQTAAANRFLLFLTTSVSFCRTGQHNDCQKG